jgi:raffinose synthase
VARSLVRLEADQLIEISLSEREFELFTFVPVEAGFAPIGLADKLNAAGAIASRERTADGGWALELRDGGAFVAYCERCPTDVSFSGQSLDFEHDEPGARLSVCVPEAGVLSIHWAA